MADRQFEEPRLAALYDAVCEGRPDFAFYLHAFQVLIEDQELRTALGAVRRALSTNGRFVFETRNPAARKWKHWVPSNAVEVTAPDGAIVRMAHQVHTPVLGDRVTFTATFSSPSWAHDEVSRSTLRFLRNDCLASFLRDAGLTIDEQFGDWNREPVTPTNPELITVARRA